MSSQFLAHRSVIRVSSATHSTHSSFKLYLFRIFLREISAYRTLVRSISFHHFQWFWKSVSTLLLMLSKSHLTRSEIISSKTRYVFTFRLLTRRDYVLLRHVFTFSDHIFSLCVFVQSFVYQLFSYTFQSATLRHVRAFLLFFLQLFPIVLWKPLPFVLWLIFMCLVWLSSFFYFWTWIPLLSLLTYIHIIFFFRTLCLNILRTYDISLYRFHPPQPFFVSHVLQDTDLSVSFCMIVWSDPRISLTLNFQDSISKVFQLRTDTLCFLAHIFPFCAKVILNKFPSGHFLFLCLNHVIPSLHFTNLTACSKAAWIFSVHTFAFQPLDLQTRHNLHQLRLC